MESNHWIVPILLRVAEMNKRIKELAEQADLLGEFTPTRTAGRYVGYINVVDIEKFAELIVRECCNIVNNLEGVHNPGDCSTVEYIKEHFGV